MEEKHGKYVCNTGGAIGSDLVFEQECLRKGIKVIAWSFEGHNTNSKNRKILTREELEEGFEHIKIANKSLKRNFYNLKPYVKNLLSRNWFQVKNSDAIYAIGNIIKPNWHQVDGGTGWACQEGIDNKKDVYVFEQNENWWFKYNYKNEIFEKHNDIPLLSKRFAGIGTREINENGIKAIKDLLNNI